MCRAKQPVWGSRDSVSVTQCDGGGSRVGFTRMSLSCWETHQWPGDSSPCLRCQGYARAKPGPVLCRKFDGLADKSLVDRQAEGQNSIILAGSTANTGGFPIYATCRFDTDIRDEIKILPVAHALWIIWEQLLDKDQISMERFKVLQLISNHRYSELSSCPSDLI